MPEPYAVQRSPFSSSPFTLRRCTSIDSRSPTAHRTIHGLESVNQASRFFSFTRKRRRYRCLDKISWGVIQISYQEYTVRSLGSYSVLQCHLFLLSSTHILHPHINSRSLPAHSFQVPFVSFGFFDHFSSGVCNLGPA